MTKIYIPAVGLEDWRKRLRQPDLHWKDDCSAKLMAESWSLSDGFPPPIAKAIAAAGQPLNTLKPLLIFPEHQIPLPPDARSPTQADVWVLASHANGLASIAVEGKKEETFGPTIAGWLAGRPQGRVTRLANLTSLIGLPSQIPYTIRYQFLHRTAGALIEAQRFRANIAVMLIQSFSAADSGFANYHSFVSLFGHSVQPDQFIQIGSPQGIELYTGWVRNVP